MPVEDYLPEWEWLWEEVHHNDIDFFVEARNRGLIDDATFEFEINLYMGQPLEPEEYLTLTEEQRKAEVGKAIFDEQRGYFATAFREVIRSMWKWILEQLKSLIDLVVNVLKPLLQDAWDFAKAQLEEQGRKVYDYTQKMFAAHSPLSPEDAPALAGKLYLFAMGAGMAAHGAAVATELLHPLKTVGLHQTAAMIGDFAGFGRICGATMGPLVNKVLGQLMTYNVQKYYRPVLPDDMLLQIMAVKPDITMEQFREGMGYMGYSDEWIDSIQKTMYHEPRYFELKMMSEDEAATDEWLRLKSRRAGFTEKDTDVMVRSYVKQASRMQRVDYYRQSFYMYKEGYITHERFEELLDEMQLRP